jgi:dissimilatory sulfite reductase related protein
MKKTIAGKDVEVNEEGYMTDLSEWNNEIGEEIAASVNIRLGPRHWDVIGFLQREFRNGVALSIRKVGKSGVVDIKEFYALFPPAPLRLAAKIAGIPKPASCI